ncbi:uncharacterized protein UTRI_02779_B [Ustilago trichophora]|uniref:Effector family protein Eff1 n=1 Tax=Ustilago trichophora TaxID=86804 RepID=A0A5C3E799_9BASI|nr:uncharacterized protein UTRI_02779_B [Ustilago trichophora]
MASPSFVMRGLLLVLVFFLKAASSSGILPADLERMLMDSEDESAPSGSTNSGHSSHPVSQITDTAAAQPMNLDGSWEDILYRQEAARPGPSNHPVSQILDTAAAQHVSLESTWQGQTIDRQTHSHQPYNLLAQYLGHDQSTEQEDSDFLKSIQVPQYTPQSRIEMLDRVKRRIYEALGVRLTRRSGTINPFDERLSKPEFYRYANNFEMSSPSFGTWPLEIYLTPDKKERFLVNQARTQSELFIKAHGLVALPHHVYLDIWHELQAKHSEGGVYGYIGTMRAPKQFSNLKKTSLMPSAIRWRALRPLSTSLVIASLR